MTLDEAIGAERRLAAALAQAAQAEIGRGLEELEPSTGAFDDYLVDGQRVRLMHTCYAFGLLRTEESPFRLVATVVEQLRHDIQMHGHRRIRWRDPVELDCSSLGRWWKLTFRLHFPPAGAAPSPWA